MKRLAEIKGLVVHAVIIGLLVLIGFYYLFYMYLPSVTNHGETITVPDLNGMSISETEEKLNKTTLQHIIVDSTTFNPKYKPGTVINQVPKASTKVKENRKIYISVNAMKVPSVSFPDLSNKSLRNAIIILESSGLKKDTVSYKPYNSPVVIGHSYNGKAIKVGEKLPKGSKIALVVGETEGNTEITVPDLIGRNYKGLKRDLENLGLILSTRWVKDNELPQNIVFKQSPEPSDSAATTVNTIKAGSIIDVWISGEEPNDSVQ